MAEFLQMDDRGELCRGGARRGLAGCGGALTEDVRAYWSDGRFANYNRIVTSIATLVNAPSRCREPTRSATCSAMSNIGRTPQTRPLDGASPAFSDPGADSLAAPLMAPNAGPARSV